MEVGWSLKGAVLHNVSVALCVSPSVHTDLNTMERCEAALCGFILQDHDLWKLVSDQTQQELQVATGSTWLAGQTMANLQGCALSTVALCVGKSSTWLPWRFGRGRLSEISIEEHFGHLRCQTSNAVLSTRSFFHADARQSLRAKQDFAKVTSRRAPPGAEEPALTDSEFRGSGWERMAKVCSRLFWSCIGCISLFNQDESNESGSMYL